MKKHILKVFKTVLGKLLIDEYVFHVEGGDNGSYSWNIRFYYNDGVYSIDTAYFIGDPNGKEESLKSVEKDLNRIKTYGKDWKYHF